jgi:hypothetical protein
MTLPRQVYQSLSAALLSLQKIFPGALHSQFPVMILQVQLPFTLVVKKSISALSRVGLPVVRVS